MKKNQISEIFRIIEEYAKAYSKLEHLQKLQDSEFPKHGDQKTGIIGEFYIYQFLKGHKELKYAAHGEPWDIEYVDDSGNQIKIQVKTVLTGFSKTNTLSPIKKGWDYIYLLALDKNFHPIGFWINKYDEKLFNGREVIPSARIKDPSNIRSEGSKIFDFTNNLFKELLKKLDEND